ncbi:MAG: glycerol-3-phosphate 1-O-acyltransferase PlsY [Akkermansiaceae bacterium]|nr:glycerol-3-phosphate 1-O-acyltransferase PlsY [Akkermansiaceae bacterium]
MTAWIVLYIAASYLVGAIPFGYLAGRCRGLDLRKEGSCNIGATNAWRVLGWRWGAPVFALDFLKGFIPVFGALHWLPFLTGDSAGWDFNTAVVLVCFAVVLGHTYTCFLGFKGGKGVATTAGVLFALNPAVACTALATWLVLVGISGIVSLASVLAAVVMIIAGWWMYPLAEGGNISSQVPYIAFFTLIGLLVIFKHRSNMARLFNGTEHSFYSKKSK